MSACAQSDHGIACADRRLCSRHGCSGKLRASGSGAAGLLGSVRLRSHLFTSTRFRRRLWRVGGRRARRLETGSTGRPVATAGRRDQERCWSEPRRGGRVRGGSCRVVSLDRSRRVPVVRCKSCQVMYVYGHAMLTTVSRTSGMSLKQIIQRFDITLCLQNISRRAGFPRGLLGFHRFGGRLDGADSRVGGAESVISARNQTSDEI